MSAIRCSKCGTVLESLSRHDFKMCECENQAFVDGGLDYVRVGAKDLDMIEILRSCEKCGRRLDNKQMIIYAYEGKPWELCRDCYTIMKGTEE